MSELEVLSPFERFAFRLVGRMNRGKWKRFWTWCQSTMGAGWIHLSTYNIMNVYGLEHVEADVEHVHLRFVRIGDEACVEDVGGARNLG